MTPTDIEVRAAWAMLNTQDQALVRSYWSKTGRSQLLAFAREHGWSTDLMNAVGRFQQASQK